MSAPGGQDHIATFLEEFRLTLESRTFTSRLQKFFLELHNSLPPKSTFEPISLNPETIEKFLDCFKEHDKKGREQRALLSPGMNIWNSLAIGRDEVKNCRILSWLLDPEADHFQGARFLKCLFQFEELKPDNKFADEKYHVSREDWIDESNRVDIIITGETYYMVIEAKIDAREGKNQCQDYKNILNNRKTNKKFIGLFLTRNGADSKDEDYKKITWKDIIKTLDIFSDINQPYSCQNAFVRNLSLQYSRYLKEMLS